MEIRNGDYVDTIIRIAEGNPRIAYMAGRLAKQNNHCLQLMMQRSYMKAIILSFGKFSNYYR